MNHLILIGHRAVVQPAPNTAASWRRSLSTICGISPCHHHRLRQRHRHDVLSAVALMEADPCCGYKLRPEINQLSVQSVAASKSKVSADKQAKVASNIRPNRRASISSRCCAHLKSRTRRAENLAPPGIAWDSALDSRGFRSDFQNFKGGVRGDMKARWKSTVAARGSGVRIAAPSA